jgi:hypothetical protein
VVVNRSYTIGDSINITGITDSLTSARSEAYTYTASNRLQEGDGIWGTLVWTFDGVGNRASEALTSGSTITNTYNYPSTSNLLSSLTQSSTTVRSFSYDGAGNVTADTYPHHLEHDAGVLPNTSSASRTVNCLSSRPEMPIKRQNFYLTEAGRRRNLARLPVMFAVGRAGLATVLDDLDELHDRLAHVAVGDLRK